MDFRFEIGPHYSKRPERQAMARKIISLIVQKEKQQQPPKKPEQHTPKNTKQVIMKLS